MLYFVPFHNPGIKCYTNKGDGRIYFLAWPIKIYSCNTYTIYTSPSLGTGLQTATKSRRLGPKAEKRKEISQYR